MLKSNHGGIFMFGFPKKEDDIGLEYDNAEDVVESQELPEYDHSNFEWEADDEDKVS